MKQIYKKSTMKKYFLLAILLWLIGVTIVEAQPATVSLPFSVGRASCGGGSHRVHFFNYNEVTNALTNAVAPAPCTPNLRYGATNFTFTSNVASISFNPKDQNIYYFWTTYSPSTRTYAWRWPLGTCPTSTSPRLDSIRSFAYDILGVAFDKNGNGWMLEFDLAGPPFKAYLRSVDFTTGSFGQADTLNITAGKQIWASGSGDIAISPNGQMYFVVDNKLFSPDYTNYGGPGKKITCTYIDTVKAPAGSGVNLVGLAYAQGKLLASYQSSLGCPYKEVNPLTGDTSAITQTGTQSTADFASVVSGVGASKKLISVTNVSGNTYDVVYDVTVQNFGNVPLTNLQVTDTLAKINGPLNVLSSSLSFISNPNGYTLNPLYNGIANCNLLSGAVALPNFPVANSSFKIRITCRISNILNGNVYNNQAFVTANGYNAVALRDLSTDGNNPDLNTNDKPDDFGENQPTPLLISVTPVLAPCVGLGNIMYSQDFGAGVGMTTAIPLSVSTTYTGSTVNPIPYESYTVTNNPNLGNTTDWINLADHTGNPLGRMLVVNADAANNVFYRDTIPSVCPGQQYTFSFYAAFIGNTSYQTVCNGFGGFKYPKVLIRVRDAATGLVIGQISTSDINTSSWTQWGMKWIMPSGFTAVIFELINDAPGGCGNDIAIDDIQFGTCDILPTVAASAPSAGCLGGTATLNSTFTDAGVIPGAKDYQWQVSADGVTWVNVPGATSATYTINPVTALEANKYYRVLVAAAGNIATPSCRYTSPSQFLSAKVSSVSPTAAVKNTGPICPGMPVTLTVSGGSLGTNATWRWYSGSCGGTLVGTGTSVVVNPLLTTTYYVRAEGDCNVSACVSVTVTISCDIDDDDDGIPDVNESGGVDPDDDADSDGLANYQDPSYPGFVDINSDGVNDNFDIDRDGIINSRDADSDNDGIPDVVEAYGVDANGDGRIDNYTDTDGDGLSQNVDGNNTGYAASGLGLGLQDLDGDGIPNEFDLDSDNDGMPDVREAGGTDANNDGKIDTFVDVNGNGITDSYEGVGALLNTGNDINGDGKADSYPNKNFDGDSRTQPYDMDSDNDGITDVREFGFTDADNNGFSDGIKGGDGWDDSIDALATLTIRNTDGDAKPDYLDIDSDNDGIPDNVEGISTSGYNFPLYADTDNDGIDNRYDLTVGFGGNGNTPNDQDGDLVPDYIDTDTDNDGKLDIIEGNDYNLNGMPDDLVTLTGIDTDGDGLDNRFDANNSSIKGTSSYMGTGGSFSGDVSPGSNTMVQMSFPAMDRDWRLVSFILDVQYLGINAIRNGNTIQVNWKVTCDKVIEKFEVERSFDGITFIKVGEVAGIGSACTATPFNFDDNVSSVNKQTLFYRVRSIFGSSSKYSTIAQVKLVLAKEIQLTPNPATQWTNVHINLNHDEWVEVGLLDGTGRLVAKWKQLMHAGNAIMQLNDLGKFSKGVYTVQVKVHEEIINRKLIIK